jgi:hypothetical protein
MSHTQTIILLILVGVIAAAALLRMIGLRG